MQEQPGQMVPPRVPLPPPTRLSGKLSGLALPESLPGGNSEPIAGIGSPEDSKAAAGVWLRRESVRVKDCWAGCPGPGFCEGIPPGGFSCPSLTQVPLSFPFPSTEHMWRLCPGPDSPESLPSRKGRTGRPWRVRPRQLYQGRHWTEVGWYKRAPWFWLCHPSGIHRAWIAGKPGVVACARPRPLDQLYVT